MMSSKQNKAWFIMADSNSCKIFTYDRKSAQLNLFKEIEHPENKLKDIDLTSDRPGHYKSSTGARGVYSQPSDPKEIKIDNFSKEIAEELNAARNNQLYSKLIIIAPPHMNGLIFKYLNKHIKNLVAYSIEKDLLHLPDHELFNFINTHNSEVFDL